MNPQQYGIKIAQPGFKTVQKIIEHKLMVPDENNG